MQTSNRFLDDLAKVASGAATTLAGVKDEIDQHIRQRIERFLTDADMVPREEFEAVRDMAANARREQEALEARVAALEAKLAELAAKPATKKTAAKKTAKKSASKATKSGDSHKS